MKKLTLNKVKMSLFQLTGNDIREFVSCRKCLNLSFEDVANSVGTSPSTIEDLEKMGAMHRTPPLTVLKPLVQFYSNQMLKNRMEFNFQLPK